MERASAQWRYFEHLAAGDDIETFSATSRGMRLVGNCDVLVRSARRVRRFVGTVCPHLGVSLETGLDVTCLAMMRLIEGARMS